MSYIYLSIAIIAACTGCTFIAAIFGIAGVLTINKNDKQ